MSLLTLIQNVCAELSLDIPGLVIGSPDPTTAQLRVLSQRAGDELARDYDWSILRIPTQFTSTGAYPEPNQPPADWERFADASVLWNNSMLWRLNGPVDAQTWQRNRIYNSNPVPQIWRLMQGGKLAIYPNTVGQIISYEYVSANWVSISPSGVSSPTWTTDNDTSLISQRVLELSLMWRWKRSKGLEYAEEMENFQRAKESEIGSDRASSAFSLSKPNRGNIPDNYWPGTIVVGP